MKYVQDRSNCSAWIILKRNKLIGKVQAVFTQSAVTVNVFDWGKSDKGIQEGKASGYGYDKLTSAMCGCVIDGITLTNHCGQDKRTERILKNYIKAAKNNTQYNDKEENIYIKKAERIGASFANWSTFYNGIESYNFEGNEKKAKKTGYYTSLFLKSGLKKLEALGYRVIQAI